MDDATSNVTFSICDVDDEDITTEEVEGGDDGGEVVATSPMLLGLPKLLQLRRVSDQGIRHVRDQIRRVSHSGSRFLRNAARVGVGGGDHGRGGRKMSVDSAGILKQDLAEQRRVPRKSVSFCQRDNVRVFQHDWVEEDDEEDEEDGGPSKEAVEDEEGNDKSLVPTFVFAGKRPSYKEDFEKSTLLLESVDISSDDMCLMGNVRVNLTKLQEETCLQKRRVSVTAVYTTDNWLNSKETRAMLVKAQPHPALKHLQTRAMRFYIDCDELEVGDVLLFKVLCLTDNHVAFSTDDNEGQCYKVMCTPKLNVWAAKAAQELKNFAPIVKYNAVHLTPSASSE